MSRCRGGKDRELTDTASIINSTMNATRVRSHSVDPSLTSPPLQHQNISINSVTSTGSIVTPHMEDRMRRKLKYFFMNPCEKYRARGRKPYKLTLQVFKIIMVTVQVCLFGVSQFSVVTFSEENATAFRHLFLKDWDPGYDQTYYPKTSPVYAVYNKEIFYDRLNFIWTQFYNIKEDAIGSYDFADVDGKPMPMQICHENFQSGVIFADNNTYIFDPAVVKECIFVKAPTPGLNETVRDRLEKQNFTINFDSLIKLEVHLVIRSIHLQQTTKYSTPNCIQFNVTIQYDNSNHDGRMGIALTQQKIFLKCHALTDDKAMHVDSTGDTNDTGSILPLTWRFNLISIFDLVVVGTSLMSCILCLRSLIKAWQLKNEFVHFFQINYNKDLSFADRMEFLNFWYVMIVISDMLTCSGGVIKVLIENKIGGGSSVFVGFFDLYDTCSLMLGTAALLVWVGVLNYLNFFRQYNILILTMKASAPNVLRFLLCATLLYMGFAFAGWLILGPYHIKFRTLNTASECMYSLINGDDMFATFYEMGQTSWLPWLYSRFYLYIFISLFIYVVLSMMISIIMDVYEAVKDYQENGFPKTDLHEFIECCEDRPESGCYRLEGETAYSIFCCCRRGRGRANTYEPILEES
ncbi:mucolipin-3-like isoform X1 [Branchiostoma floridae x Branchiostoma belcheri]